MSEEKPNETKTTEIKRCKWQRETNYFNPCSCWQSEFNSDQYHNTPYKCSVLIAVFGFALQDKTVKPMENEDKNKKLNIQAIVTYLVVKYKWFLFIITATIRKKNQKKTVRSLPQIATDILI